ncbi:MAG: endonuclease/exonuclease/phosphatase family protein [Akkermansiaceae bacterium]|nr:endonuclease/exonuclease/phosphatase family protein [Akkermansiaceae bacterium]
MIRLRVTSQNFLKAPAITGALFCLWLGLGACEKEGITPDWSAEQRPAAATPSTVSTEADSRPQTAAPGLRFMAYNVENWLVMERGGRERGKPEKEKAAVVRLIVEHRPDVLGICEIGERSDVEELMKRLKASGWEMPHLAYDDESHALRRQALLSRFPIVATADPEKERYRMLGREWRMSRPILDATVEREGCRYRFVGVHLKSKREVDHADQEQMRRHEARLLRGHIEAILKADPDVRLVAYGDFNDSRKSVAMKTVAGTYRSPTYLTAIPCEDSRGHRWTHHWEYQDIYSRFDYILVSPGLRPEADFDGSYTVDDPSWATASDHRPVVGIFRASADKK